MAVTYAQGTIFFPLTPKTVSPAPHAYCQIVALSLHPFSEAARIQRLSESPGTLVENTGTLPSFSFPGEPIQEVWGRTQDYIFLLSFPS